MPITDTLMQEYAEYSAKFDLNNLGRFRNGMALFGLESAKDAGRQMFTADQIAGKKKNLAQSVQLASIERGGVSVTTTRQALPIAQTLGDTLPVAISFNVHEAEFTVVDEEFRGNQVAKDQYIARQMLEAQKLIMNQIDAAAVTAFDGGKAQTTNSAGNPFAFTANEFIIPSAAASTKEEERLADWRVFLDYWDSIVASDGHQNIGDQTYMIGSANAKAFMNYAAGYGTANEQNKLQSWNGIVPYISNNIAVDPVGPPAERCNAYFALPQSFEIHTWNSGDAKEGYDDGNKMLTTMYSELLQSDIELLRIKDLANYSAINPAYNRVKGEQYVMTIETAFVLPANTTPASFADRHYGASFQVG